MAKFWKNWSLALLLAISMMVGSIYCGTQDPTLFELIEESVEQANPVVDAQPLFSGTQSSTLPEPINELAEQTNPTDIKQSERYWFGGDAHEPSWVPVVKDVLTVIFFVTVAPPPATSGGSRRQTSITTDRSSMTESELSAYAQYQEMMKLRTLYMSRKNTNKE